MTPAARLSAAIEVFADIEARRRPAADALKDWGLTHRFAGSGDRSSIGSLVYDSLRKKASASWIMREATPRAAVLGALALTRSFDGAALAALCTGEGHAPSLLSADERAHIDARSLEGAPLHVRADIPEFLTPSFGASLGAMAEGEGKALAERAPVDLRANTLKGERDALAVKLAHLSPVPTPLSPLGLRIAITPEGRAPALHVEPSFIKGLFEVQDEGSQLAALLSGAKPGMQTLDLCAGGGGKALALAAMMDNQGQVFATDTDLHRLAPIHERLQRSGAHNIQVLTPRRGIDELKGLEARCDLVFVDAPCTGVGAWRRNPDAKWRMRPNALDLRVREQDEVLAKAAGAVKPGGRLHYVTCSLLRAENEDRVRAFLEKNPHFLPLDAARMAVDAGLPSLSGHVSTLGPGLRLSPLSTGTDGFYICAMMRT